MDYAEFTADLPADHVSFGCVEENEEALKRHGAIQEERQLGRGRFRAALAACEIDGVALFADRFDTAVSLYCQPASESIAIMIPRCAEGHFHARRHGAGHRGGRSVRF